MGDHPSRTQQLYEDLGKLIANTKPGERLLTEPQLARQLGVSRATLREAMRLFETQGLIQRRQGSGTFVVHPTHTIDTGLEVLESIETLAARIGLQVKIGEFNVDRRPAHEEEQKILGLETGEKVVYVSRIILAEGRPVAYLIDTLPNDTLPPQELESAFTGSVLDLLLRRGDPPLTSSRTEISAVQASGEVARALNIQRGDVLLHFTAQLFAAGGRVIDYSHSYFLPGYFHFHVVRRVGSFTPR